MRRSLDVKLILRKAIKKVKTEPVLLYEQVKSKKQRAHVHLEIITVGVARFTRPRIWRNNDALDTSALRPAPILPYAQC